MTFIELEYGLFLSLVFIIYWFVLNKNFKNQNLLILVASYIFYGWWDWRFLLLIFISSLVDFCVGILLDKNTDKTKRRLLLFSSLFVNLGLLFFFKYFNFFLDTFKFAFNISNEGFSTLDIILPVGISFYTLQTLSYTIDVFDKKIKATKDSISFFAYVSFFPQLVSGPIEKATDLLPQFFKERSFDYNKATDGIRQILWGLFKKMVVADNCGSFVDFVFITPESHDGSTLFLTAVLGSFQFYCDFSGYCDIAIGSAKLLGFDLSKNFDFPFFSRNVSEFWKKWHITLINWLRFYVVNKLRGFSKRKVVRNIFIIFAITGLWHGANFTFILWGILHGLTFLPSIYGKRTKYKQSVAKGKLLPSIKESYLMIRTFLIFSLIGVFFRIDTVYNGFLYLQEVFSPSFFKFPDSMPSYTAIIAVVILVIVEWLQREKNHGLEMNVEKTPLFTRWSIYFSLVLVILFFGVQQKAFIYFQF